MHLPVVRSEGPAADRGQWRHAFLASVGKVGAGAALAAVPPEHRDACAALPLDELPVDLAPEVAFALDVATGKARIVGHDIGRNYGELGPMELAGTADVVGRGEDGSLLVLDYKSNGHRGRAVDSVQLRFLALAAARAYDGVDTVRVEIVRLGDAGEVSRSWHVYDALDLDAFAVELRQWFAAAARNADAVEGDHCNHCPSFAHCPAKARLLQLAAGGDPAAPFFSGGGLSRSTVGAAWQTVQALRAICRELEKRIHGALDELGPCPTTDGRELRKVLTDGVERLDGEVVHRVITQLYGRDAADRAVEYTATKTKVREALRAANGKLTSAMEREVFDTIRAAGGVRRTKGSERIDEVDVRGDAA